MIEPTEADKAAADEIINLLDDFYDECDVCETAGIISQHMAPERQAFAALREENERLKAAIRKHRDYRGDDRCWLDDEELYRLLPEGYTAPARDTFVDIHECERFIRCRHNPGTEYVSSQREIERLTKALDAFYRHLDTYGVVGETKDGVHRMLDESDPQFASQQRCFEAYHKANSK